MDDEIDGLGAPLAAVERRRKTLEVYTDSSELVGDLRAQFSTRNVRVVGQSLTDAGGQEFVVVRGADGTYSGALGVEQFRKILSPEIPLPFALDGDEADLAELFDFLDNTLFASFDRRQMLAVSREIEERAWRVGRGTLFVGFQNADAVRAQRGVYEHFARESDLSLWLFIVDELDGPFEGVDVVSDGPSELGQYWFLLFDGGDQHSCGLLAEERDPGEYYGFWTYEPAMVGEMMDYLRATYR